MRKECGASTVQRRDPEWASTAPAQLQAILVTLVHLQRQAMQPQQTHAEQTRPKGAVRRAPCLPRRESGTRMVAETPAVVERTASFLEAAWGPCWLDGAIKGGFVQRPCKMP